MAFASASHSDGVCFTTLYIKGINGNEVMISSGSANGWIEDVYPDHLCGDDDQGYMKNWTQFPEGYYRIWYYWNEDIQYANRMLEKANILVMEYYKTSCWFLYNSLIIPKYAVAAIEYH